MNSLISVRTNIMYAKKKKEVETEPDEFKRYQEVIFLVDKPTYRRTNDNDIIRERQIDEVRFTVSDKAFEELIEILKKLRTASETDLH